ncbi:MAG: hypothetical protein EXR75_07955 [Myxococcales bacterium]|nr:hypothetical protein [Myxococcales bacterium]
MTRTASGDARGAGDGFHRPERHVRDSVPRGVVLIVELEVAALRANDLTRGLWDAVSSIDGQGNVTALCGFHPLERIATLALVVPEDDSAGFGVVASGPLDQGSLLACAATVVKARGGTPVREIRGEFGVLVDSAAALSGAELMVREGGPLVLAEPKFSAAVRAVVAGQAPSLAGDAAHQGERAIVGDGALVATATLTPEHRRRLREELATAHVTDAFAHLLSGGLSIRIGPTLAVHGTLLCDEAASCSEVGAAVRTAFRQAQQSPSALALGITEVLGRVRVDVDRDRINLRAHLPFEEALGVVQRMLSRARRSGSMDSQR